MVVAGADTDQDKKRRRPAVSESGFAGTAGRSLGGNFYGRFTPRLRVSNQGGARRFRCQKCFFQTGRFRRSCNRRKMFCNNSLRQIDFSGNIFQNQFQITATLRLNELQAASQISQ